MLRYFVASLFHFQILFNLAVKIKPLSFQFTCNESMRRSLMSSKHLFILARRLRSNKGFITFLYWWVLDIGGSSICGGIVGTMFISVISIYVFFQSWFYFLSLIDAQLVCQSLWRNTIFRVKTTMININVFALEQVSNEWNSEEVRDHWCST